MDDAAWRELVRQSMVRTWRLFATSSPGGSVVERPGLLGAVVPAAPERSVFNSVIYADSEALAGTLDELARTYEQAGVRAWTVWVPEADRETAHLLERAGHKLDATPRAMAMALANAEQPDPLGVHWRRDVDLDTIARINEAAYGLPPGDFAPVIGAVPPQRVNTYCASTDGETVAVMMTEDFGFNTEISFVATLPAARGKGLATVLMRQALWDARERRLETATLQATKPGYPIYLKLGFRDLGVLEMWERRAPRE